MIGPGFALHPAADVDLGWTWDPLPLTTLLVATTIYVFGLVRLWRVAGVARGLGVGQVACYCAGLVALVAALLSPLDTLSDRLFAAHMSQHELLMVVAAPLLVLGRPLTAYVWTLPRRERLRVGRWLRRPVVRWCWEFLSAPLFVLVLHAVVRWLWHVPALFEAAMRDEALHALQHLSFFSTAALFWWALVHGRYGAAGYGLAVLFVFATALHTSVLGAIIGVAPRLIYSIYRGRAEGQGWDPLTDQQLAGLIMWIPSGALFMITGLGLLAAWLGEAERRARRSA